MDDIYREVILDHYKNPRNYGSLDRPDSESEKDNPLCGDKICIQLVLSKDKTLVEDIKFSGQGCAISMASASLVTEYAQGKEIRVLKGLGKDDIVKLLNINLSPARLKCALLPLNVLQEAIV